MECIISEPNYRVYEDNGTFSLFTDDFICADLTLAGLYSFLYKEYTDKELIDIITKKTNLTENQLLSDTCSYIDVYWIFLGNKLYYEYLSLEFLKDYFDDDEINYVIDNSFIDYEEIIKDELNKKLNMSQKELIDSVNNNEKLEFFKELIYITVSKFTNILYSTK